MYDSAILTMAPCIGVGTCAALIYAIIARHPLLPPDYAKFKIRVYESVCHLVILLAYAEILYAVGIMKFDGKFEFHDVIIYWLIHDMVYYGFHYIQHKFKIGKHSIHHDQQEVYPLYAFARSFHSLYRYCHWDGISHVTPGVFLSHGWSSVV